MAPNTAAKIGRPLNQDKELLMVVATNTQRVHIHKGDKKGEGQASPKSTQPKYMMRLSATIPKTRAFNRRLNSAFGEGERQT